MEKDFADVLKNAKPLSADKAKAKAAKLKELMDMIKGGMANDIKGLKKVTVASDSPEGLEAGLDKAKDLLGKTNPLHAEEEAIESPVEEASETPEEEKSEEAKIAELEKQLEELKAKKRGTELASAKDSIKSVF